MSDFDLFSITLEFSTKNTRSNLTLYYHGFNVMQPIHDLTTGDCGKAVVDTLFR